ncbi:oxidoreductase [Chryseosolibacter indicus]|uniref:Oxidoreductase n=1 Tax=Chryseosolibacter indicus TaxID=2782351 RepID=A0ABS5VL79_9BACT|nr:oxidoreductase [Chryseosolibacter indicus]MBT1701753.1 oxidoreductase [Chryseosolibacter indicus]
MNVKPLSTALLSYGMSGEIFHAPLLNTHPGFSISAVYQRNASKQYIPGLNVVHSLEQILQDPTIDLVIVNTPNHTHFQFASEALKAGKHVIVEKPFTVSVSEADKLIMLAQKQGKLLSVFQNRRWDGDFLTVQRILQDKMLGRVVEFEAHYDRYRNYIEPNTWKEEEAPGTGILYNLGSHMLDQVIVLFGMPAYVDARIGTQRTGGKVDDYYDIRLEYSSLNVIVKSSYLVREPVPRYTIHGTKGSFIKYGIDPQEQDLKEKKVPGSEGWGKEDRRWWGKINTEYGDIRIEGDFETVPGNYLAFYDNIFEAIRSGVPLMVKPEQARGVIYLIECCIESSKTRKAIKV